MENFLTVESRHSGTVGIFNFRGRAPRRISPARPQGLTFKRGHDKVHWHFTRYSGDRNIVVYQDGLYVYISQGKINLKNPSTLEWLSTLSEASSSCVGIMDENMLSSRRLRL